MTATDTPLTISVAELAELCESGSVQLLDVRTPAEFQEVHVPQARNLPLNKLDPKALDHSQHYLVICRSGNRGQQACEKLRAAGFNVTNVDGGTLAWERAGFAVIRGRKVMSLERQVRIVAGGLACVGAVLALTVHVWFAGIPAFIGAGLVFAGVSDTCGMGMILARMPWNQRGS
jgi:rhodanese-related sulfurtransferase